MSKLPSQIVLATPKMPRLPSKVAARCDALYEMRELRLEYGSQIKEAEKVLSELKRREDEIARQLAADMRKDLGNASKLSGQVATFSTGETPVFSVDDWDAYYKFIEDNQAWELLERRPSRGALKERYEDDGKLPDGVRVDKMFTYSLTKAGKK